MTTLFSLFLSFFFIGSFSIGGGYAIIPLIQQQVVEKEGWITQAVFTDMIAISQMTPGPLAVNTSTFVGLKIAGIPGALLATLGCVITGVCLSVFLHRIFSHYGESPYLLKIIGGLKAASLGLIVSAAFTIILLAFTGQSHLSLSAKIDFISVSLFIGSFLCLRKLKWNPVLCMVLAAIAGGFLYSGV